MPRHHLVPQMVLRRFADANQRIVMVGREVPHRVVETVVRTAAAETGFYRIETEDLAETHQDGHDPEAIEKVLSAIEAIATPFLQELADGRLPRSYEDRYQLSKFIAIQYARGWGFREEMNEVATLMMRNELRSTLDVERVKGFLVERDLPHGPDDVDRFIDNVLSPNGPRLEISQPHAVQQTLLHALKVVMPLIYQRRWTLMRFAEPCLLTSDSPVASWSPPSDNGLPFGIANAQESYMPIDRKTVLVIDLTDAAEPDGEVVHGTAADAQRINLVVAEAAARWIFHHPDDQPLVNLDLSPRAKWVEEITSVTEEPDGVVRVKGMYARRSMPDEPASP